MGSSDQESPRGPTPIPATAPLTPQEALEMRMRAAERAHDTETAFGTANNTAAVKSGEEAIKAALLINGGSSVAMLAFIGTLVSQHFLSSEQLSNAIEPLFYFGFGVVASIIASAAAYFTNLMIAGDSNRRERNYLHPFIRETPTSKNRLVLTEVFRWLAILAVGASIGCFIWGLITAKSAFSNLTQPEKPTATKMLD